METQKTKSPNKKNSLGRGMAALLNSNVGSRVSDLNTTAEKPDLASGPIEPNIVKEVGIHLVAANKNQPRKIFKESEIKELSESIAENGLIQPIVVQETQGGYELIAGERRLRASKLAGLKRIPVIVKRTTKKDSLVMAIIENVQRSDLNCVEEALAYYQLMEEFSLTQEEVAKKIGKQRSTIANFLRILKLPREVIALLQKEILSFGHAKVLSGIKEREQLIRVANTAATEGLSVRETEKLANSKFKNNKEQSNPFFDENLSGLKDKLEKQTGYHFDINSKKNGAGQIKIKFNNEAEFNDIFEFLMR